MYLFGTLLLQNLGLLYIYLRIQIRILLNMMLFYILFLEKDMFVYPYR